MRPMVRRVLWFATAYTIVIIVHEGAHAITAYGLGLEATLFNFCRGGRLRPHVQRTCCSRRRLFRMTPYRYQLPQTC